MPANSFADYPGPSHTVSERRAWCLALAASTARPIDSARDICVRAEIFQKHVETGDDD